MKGRHRRGTADPAGAPPASGSRAAGMVDPAAQAEGPLPCLQPAGPVATMPSHPIRVSGRNLKIMAETTTISRKAASPRPRRKQAERRASSDSELLNAANKLVAEEGVRCATFQKIAAVAGFSSGLVAQRFGSKEGLIESQLKRAHDSFRIRIGDMQRSSRSGLEAILQFILGYITHLESDLEIRAYTRLMADAVANFSPNLERFANAHENFQAVMVSLLTEGQAQGEVRNDLDPKHTAYLIGCTTLGMSIQSIIDNTTDLEAVSKQYVAALKQMLSPEARAGSQLPGG
jgi:AcrR family transcriptional regulator